MSIEYAKGKWSLHSSENFDEYMKAIGVGLATRLIVNKLKPDIEISINDGNKWTLKTLSTFRNTESTFTIDTPFKESTPDGREVEVLCTVEGNTLKRVETGKIPTVAYREFSENEQKCVLDYNGVICTRIYRRATK